MIEKFDFETFEKYAGCWMKNMKMNWLITGHLKKENAMKIVMNAESALNYRHISEETCQFVRSILL